MSKEKNHIAVSIVIRYSKLWLLASTVGKGAYFKIMETGRTLKIVSEQSLKWIKESDITIVMKAYFSKCTNSSKF